MATSVFASEQSRASNQTHERKLIIDSLHGFGMTDQNGKDPVVTLDNPLLMVDMVVGTNVGAAKGGGVGALILSSYGPGDYDSIEVVIQEEAFKHITHGASNNEIYQFGLEYALGAIRFISKEDIAFLGNGDFRFKFQRQNAEILDESAKRIIGDRPITSFNISVNDRAINKLNGGIQVAIPYEGRTGEDVHQLALYQVGPQGKISKVINSAYTEIRKSNGDKPYIQALIYETGSYAIGYEKLIYKDIVGWYGTCASYVLDRGIMDEKNGFFMPKDPITRADLAFYLHNMSEQNIESSSNAFSDVLKNHPYVKSIDWAYETGLIKGYEDGRFKPNQLISRQELAVMLDRYTKIIAKTYIPMPNKQESFKDNHEISAFAKESVSYLQQADVIAGRGSGYFVPGDNVTRAECARMIAALMDSMMNGKNMFVPMN